MILNDETICKILSGCGIDANKTKVKYGSSSITWETDGLLLLTMSVIVPADVMGRVLLKASQDPMARGGQ